MTKFKPDGQIDYTTLLGPTPQYDASGYTQSLGFQVVIGADDLPLVSFETFETETLELQAGGLLPLPGPPLLHVVKLDTAGQPISDVIAPVLDIPGHYDPYDFVLVQLTTDSVSDAYLAYTAARPTPGHGVALDTFLMKLSSSGEQVNIVDVGSPVNAIDVDGDFNVYIAQIFFCSKSNGRGGDLPVRFAAYSN